MTSARLCSAKIGVPLGVLFLFCLPAVPINVPPAPPGFSWQEVPDLKAAFLKPSGWFYREETQPETLAVFITKEDISKVGEFQTGMSLNVFHLRKDRAVDRGKDMVTNIAKAKHAEMWTRKFGPFVEFGCQVTDADASGTIVMHVLTVANPKTNTLYYFTFESPESSWDDAWKLGKQIIDMLALDDEV
jgi:hypothetical protein